MPPVVGSSVAIPSQPAKLLDQQLRFRVQQSDQPISQRTITPDTGAARELWQKAPAVRDAVAGVLGVVELAAGGADASRSVPVNGIAFATSDDGHGINIYSAHADDSAEFSQKLASAGGDSIAVTRQWLQQSMDRSRGTEAVAVAGWMNLGSAISKEYLEATLLPKGDSVPSDRLGRAVRIIRHEAQHIADHQLPVDLDQTTTRGLRESLAEAASTGMDNLQAARAALGLDAVVSDAALEKATFERPYAREEQQLRTMMSTAGITPDSELARKMLAGTSRNFITELERVTAT